MLCHETTHYVNSFSVNWITYWNECGKFWYNNASMDYIIRTLRDFPVQNLLNRFKIENFAQIVLLSRKSSRLPWHFIGGTTFLNNDARCQCSKFNLVPLKFAKFQWNRKLTLNECKFKYSIFATLVYLGLLKIDWQIIKNFCANFLLLSRGEWYILN